MGGVIVSEPKHARWPLGLWAPRKRNTFYKFWWQKAHNYIDITPVEWDIEERLDQRRVGIKYGARQNRPKFRT